MRASNLILIFVDSCCYVEEGLRCSQSELWTAFCDWVPDLKKSRIGRNTFYKIMLDYFPREGSLFSNLTLRDQFEWEYLEEEDLCRVYLIGDGECVKIGISYNPSYRLKIMQTGNSRDLVLFASFPGGEKEEDLLHDYFKGKHKRGEWYFLDDEDILRIFGYFSGVELK